MTSRNNDYWIAQLSGRGSDQQAALSDLRQALLRGLRGALSNRADDAFLEDIVQDALVRILARIRQFEGRSQFLTWATSIAIRIAMTELRRRRWQDVSLDATIAAADLAPESTVDEAAGWMANAVTIRSGSATCGVPCVSRPLSQRADQQTRVRLELLEQAEVGS